MTSTQLRFRCTPALKKRVEAFRLHAEYESDGEALRHIVVAFLDSHRCHRCRLT